MAADYSEVDRKVLQWAQRGRQNVRIASILSTVLKRIVLVLTLLKTGTIHALRSYLTALETVPIFNRTTENPYN